MMTEKNVGKEFGEEALWDAHMRYRERFHDIVPTEQLPLNLVNEDDLMIAAIEKCLAEGKPILDYYPLVEGAIY